MIDLDKDHCIIVCHILETFVPECEVRVFGSRVKGRASRYSDLDLAIVCTQKIAWQQLDSLKNSFSESDLPMCVDIVDWHAVSVSFRQCISEQYEIIKVGSIVKPK